MTNYVMVANNALHVLIMSYKLIPPFIMREFGLIANDIMKIHDELPTKEHNSIYNETLDVCIPLSLTGTFSYFNTRSLTSY